MKLTKVDIAKALGLKFSHMRNEIQYKESKYVFSFHGKEIAIWEEGLYSVDEAWEEAAEKLLEPLVDYLLGNLDDE